MSTGFGEWTDTPVKGDPPAAGGERAIAAAVASIDVNEHVQDAVRAVVRRRLEAIAGDALDEVLDDELLEQLRAAAQRLAVEALTTPPDPEPQLYYATLMDFVTDYLTPLYRRGVTGNATTWCAQWWKHAEAITRLEALWRSWEHLRLDPHTGMSVWLRDHADHHMAILLSADGPFKGCKLDKHSERLEPLPTVAPPDGRATLR